MILCHIGEVSKSLFQPSVGEKEDKKMLKGRKTFAAKFLG